MSLAAGMPGTGLADTGSLRWDQVLGLAAHQIHKDLFYPLKTGKAALDGGNAPGARHIAHLVNHFGEPFSRGLSCWLTRRAP